VSGTLLPQGGGSLHIEEWLDVVEADYLRSFLPAGGAAVKVAVAGSPATAEELTRQLAARAATAGLAVAEIDAASTRIHLVDQVFAEVSRQLDWPEVARGWLRQAYSDLSVTPGDVLAVRAVARRNGRDIGELERGVRRRLEQTLLADAQLPRDLRTAVLRLAQVEAALPETRRDEADATLGWLRGDAVPAVMLRRLVLSAKVTRSSARPLLVALGHVLRASGGPGLGGLVLVVDAGRLAVGRRPPLPERDGLYYSKAAVLDAWEVLRQLIDATEAMTGMLVVVVVPPELITDEARGLPAYTALQLRVADEVRDRRRANPFAALVRLDVRLEAVPEPAR
jgi:hypothetical protein